MKILEYKGGLKPKPMARRSKFDARKCLESEKYTADSKMGNWEKKRQRPVPKDTAEYKSKRPLPGKKNRRRLPKASFLRRSHASLTANVADNIRSIQEKFENFTRQGKSVYKTVFRAAKVLSIHQ